MPEIKKVAGYNLLILLIYSIIIRALFGNDHDDYGILLVSAFVIAIHTLANIIFCIVNYSTGKKVLGKAFLLSTGIVLLIGFSTCLGNASF